MEALEELPIGEAGGGRGKEAGEEPQQPILQPIPMNLNPTATAQATKSPLPVAPSTNQVYILLAAQSQHKEAPTTKATSIALPILQKFKKLVATVQASTTTSKTQAAAYIAWHSGWFGCRFGFGAPEPQHFLSSPSHFFVLIFLFLFYFIVFYFDFINFSS